MWERQASGKTLHSWWKPHIPTWPATDQIGDQGCWQSGKCGLYWKSEASGSIAERLSILQAADRIMDL